MTLAMRRTSPLLAAVLALALAAAGCGGSNDSEGKNAKRYQGDQKDVAQTIDDLVAASHAGDTGKICNDIFTTGLAKAVAVKSKTTCANVVKKQLVNPKEDITITKLSVHGSNAFVTVREQNKNVTNLSLVKEGDGWRINAIQ